MTIVSFLEVQVRALEVAFWNKEMPDQLQMLFNANCTVIDAYKAANTKQRAVWEKLEYGYETHKEMNYYLEENLAA